jgi:hypothetical protein
MRDNITTDIRKTRLEGVGWIHLAQSSSREYGNEPFDSIKSGQFLTISAYY